MVQIKIDGHSSKYGIIGNPVTHTLSPNMHTQAFQEIGINAVYLPFEITENQLPDLLNSFDLLGIKGFNVTVPYKTKILPFLDQLSAEAEILQSVNTVKKINDDWCGYSTDGSGLVRSLADMSIPIKDKRVLLLGAGGSAAAIAYALMNADVFCLQVYNRTQSKAKDLINKLQPHFPHRKFSIDPKQVNSKFDLLINATSVGLNEDISPVSTEIVSLCDMVVDIIYSPLQTKLMKIADSLSIQNCNGLGMLLYQGVEAFEIWTEKQAPVKKMKETLFKSFV